MTWWIHPALLRALPALILCCTLPAEAAKKNDKAEERAVIIHNAEQFNRHLEDLALQMQGRTTCVFRNTHLLNPRSVEHLTVWYDYSNSYNTAIYPQNIAAFEFVFKDNAKLLAAHCNPQLANNLSRREQLALEEARQRIRSLIHPGMTDAQKILALHDDLVHRATYTRETKGNCTDLLLDGRGTCEAYSRTLWLLCRMAGIPCHIVYGHTTENHAWNLVRIEHRWYHVDATWNDPVNHSNPNHHILSHRYFLLSDKQISTDHSWARSHLPEAASKNADYYRQLGCFFSADAALWETLTRTINSGKGSLEVYVQHYGSETDFAARLRNASYHMPELRAITSWEGPTTEAGVVRFTFINAGKPEFASTSNLELSQEVVIETHRLFRKINSDVLQEQIAVASSWWQSIVRFFTSIWEVILWWLE